MADTDKAVPGRHLPATGRALSLREDEQMG